MVDIKIPGCTMDITPDDRPALGIFGLESTGKTRLAATAPGPIGLLAICKKSRRTFCEIAGQLGTQVIVNEKPFISDKDAVAMATLSGDNPQGLAKIKETYTVAVEKILATGMKYAEHPDIKTIVVDTCSQFFEMILYSHFGRRNQIKPTSRGAANQDLIDFINGTRQKNLILIHRAKEIWKSTGAKDRDGNDIKEPSGKYEQDSFKHVGGFLTANIELTSKRTKTDDLASKFRCKVVTSQSNVLMEGQDLHDYGISGSEINWDNIITILGLLDES